MILVLFIGLNYIQLACNWIYIHNQTTVNSVNGESNLHNDLQKIHFNKYLQVIIDF